MIIPIGSCRIHNPVRRSKRFDLPMTVYTHSSKEALQMLEFYFQGQENKWYFESTGKSDISSCYVDFILVEICTTKVYFYQEEKEQREYVSCMIAKDAEVKGINIIQYDQSVDEIQSDIQRMSQLVDYPIVVVGHIVPNVCSQYIEHNPWWDKVFSVRLKLNQMLMDVCHNLKGVTFIDINEIFESTPFKELLLEKSNPNNEFDLDLLHYSPDSFTKVFDFIEKKYESLSLSN